MITVLNVTKKLISLGISLYVGNLVSKDLGIRIDKTKHIIEAKIDSRREKLNK